MTRLVGALRRKPRLIAVSLVTALGLLLFARSVMPVTPLAETRGFAEALAAIETTRDATTFVVVWPPEQALALHTLPPTWQAADAVPLGRPWRTLLVLLPSDCDPPPELDDQTPSERRFGDVAVLTYQRQP